MVQRPADHVTVTVSLMIKPVIEAVEYGAQTFFRRRMVIGRVAPVRRQHRVEREGNTQADDHRTRYRQGERTKPLSRYAGHESNWNEYGDDRESRRGHGQADFSRAFQRRLATVLAHLHVAHDVFPHHDGVI